MRFLRRQGANVGVRACAVSAVTHGAVHVLAAGTPVGGGQADTPAGGGQDKRTPRRALRYRGACTLTLLEREDAKGVPSGVVEAGKIHQHRW
jgi:hypothetical protein